MFLCLAKQPEHHRSPALHPKCRQAERVAQAGSCWAAWKGEVVDRTRQKVQGAVTLQTGNSMEANTRDNYTCRVKRCDKLLRFHLLLFGLF